MPPEEFSDIGSVKALLADARERIKESEDRSNTRIKEVEKRIHVRIDDIEELATAVNTRTIEWMPLISNLHKAEESKRNMTLLLIVALISNIASWVLTIFIYFIKSGVASK